jgi:D-alanyl-D-alanine carboxypeptidase (penicillin-binding protein 5/6)
VVRPRSARLAIVTSVLALCMLASPATATAARLGTDRVAGVPLAKRAIPAAAAPDVGSAAAVVMTAQGDVVWSRNGDARRAMASTTKLMTALVALEQGALDKRIRVSPAAASTPYGIGLKAGMVLPKRKLLELALVASSNDAAYALGEDAGPGMPAFVKKMNDKATALGLRNTRFVNAHGLDSPGHYSSPSDLARILVADTHFAEFRRDISLLSVSAPGIAPLKATDKLLRVYPGFVGGKTGTTNIAGYSFAGMAKRGGVALVAVVLGAPSTDARFSETARLLDWGFRHTRIREVATKGVSAGTIVVDGTTVPLVQTRSASSLMFDLGGPVKRTLHLREGLAAPVFAGQTVGEMTYTQGAKVLARVPVSVTTGVAPRAVSVGRVPVSDYVDRVVVARSTVATSVPAFDSAQPLDRRVLLPSKVSAPVFAGQRLGEVRYLQRGRVVMAVPVVAAEGVQRPAMLESVGISLLRGWHVFIAGFVPGRG